MPAKPKLRTQRVRDPKVIALAATVAENAEAAAAYVGAREKLKELYRGLDRVYLPGFGRIELEYASYTSYRVPKEVKAKYAATDPVGKCSIRVFRKESP